MTPRRPRLVPEVLEVHVVPLSEEVRMVPELPTATKVLFPKVTSWRLFIVTLILVLSSQEAPLFEEVRMVPSIPTATNVSFPKVTLANLFVVPEVLLSQDVPLSEEVRTNPE